MGRAFEFRKERKMKRWASMSKTFTKIGREITMAVKESGSDPSSNTKLRALIQNAKAVNMPKDNVERAIKKATSRDASSFEEVTFEGYAQHGIAIMVEATTDNNNRTVANVRACFNKCEGSLGTSGSVEFMFDHICTFQIVKPETLDLDEFELDSIDCGVKDINQEDDHIFIEGDFKDYGSIYNYLEENKYEIVESGLDRIPNVTKKLEGEDLADVEKLLEKLDDEDDLMRVFSTLED